MSNLFVLYAFLPLCLLGSAIYFFRATTTQHNLGKFLVSPNLIKELIFTRQYRQGSPYRFGPGGRILVDPDALNVPLYVQNEDGVEQSIFAYELATDLEVLVQHPPIYYKHSLHVLDHDGKEWLIAKSGDVERVEALFAGMPTADTSHAAINKTSRFK